MNRLGTAALMLVLGVAPVAAARGGHFGHGGGGFRGGFHGHSHGRVIFGGGVFFDPFFFPGYYYPYGYGYPYGYPYPYSYPYPGYGYPPPAGGESDWGQAPESGAEENEPAQPDVQESASYGLVQLRGAPDGASIDLDGRFWMTAQDLDDRWLALPAGVHTLAVRVGNAAPVSRRVDVRQGEKHVVRFGPFPRTNR